MGHPESGELPETDLFHPSLRDICQNQPEIGKLAQKNNFISVGYVYNPEQLSFGAQQKNAINNWIKDITIGRQV